MFDSILKQRWFGLSLLLSVIMLAGVNYAEPFQLGTDEYPIGMYSVERASQMEHLQGSGVTYVHSYSLGSRNDDESIERYIAYLDMAQEYGMKVMFNLRGKHWVTMEDGIQEMLVVVNAVKDHPALGFWYLYDEPSRTHDPEEILPYYWALKKVSPDIPVAIVNCWTESWNRYSDTLDIQMVDLYPIKNLPFPETNLKLMSNFVGQALELGKPVMPINQSFRWSDLRGNVNDTEYNDIPVADYRFPNREEIRYLSYSSLTQGICGSFWWSFYHAVHRPGYDWLDEVFVPETREFREFVDLVAPASEPEVLVRSRDDADILAAIFERETGTYLVMVNNWPLEREQGRWLEERIDNADLTPWGSTRDTGANIRNGRMSKINLLPWEVLIWEVEEIIE